MDGGDHQIPSWPGRPPVPPQQPYTPLPSNEAVAWWKGLPEKTRAIIIVCILVAVAGGIFEGVRYYNDPCRKARSLSGASPFSDSGKYAQWLDAFKACNEAGGDPGPDTP